MTSANGWPQSRQYLRAVQTPRVCFSDDRLRQATIYASGGVPRATSGRSAIVFKATANTTDIAIRCFTRAVPDQHARYHALQAHLGPALPPYLVRFAYREQEILVGKDRYPLVEMDWVEGKPLDAWIGAHLGRGTYLEDQAAAWLAMISDMLDRELAHGDIANDNCLVTGSQLKLIDYDGCFIPGLAGQNPGESGAQNFQHPSRSGYYAGNMDAFPSLVVFLSLLALQGDPSLWGRFHTDKNLIFHDVDFKELDSDVWTTLASSGDDRVRLLAAALAAMCGSPVATLPSLREVTTHAGIVLTAEPPWKLATKQWWQSGLTTGRPAGSRPDPAIQVTPPDLATSAAEATSNTATTPADPAPAPSMAWLEDHRMGGSRIRNRPVNGVKPVSSERMGPQPTADTKPQPTAETKPQSAPASGQPTSTSKPRATATSRPRGTPADKPTPSEPAEQRHHPVRTTLLVILLLVALVILAGVLGH